MVAPNLPIEFTRGPYSGGVRRDGYRSRKRDLPNGHVTEVSGIRVTTPERTFVDLASRLSVATTVAFGDSALRQQLMSPLSLDAILADCAGRRGIRRARWAADLLDPRAESPRESMLRVHIVEAGLPRPTPQLVIRDSNDRFIARGDLAYEDLKIVIEYDGEHHLTRAQQARDANRRHRLALEGWLVVTVTSEDMRNPRRAVRKVEQALDSRAH